MSFAEHEAKVGELLARDTTGIFHKDLAEACKSVSIYGSPASINWSTLRVPNWVISADRSFMHPTTHEAQAVYFKWFQANAESDNNEAALLQAISSKKGFSDGERGNALERLLSAKMTKKQSDFVCSATVTTAIF